MGRSPQNYEKSQQPWYERMPVTGSLMPITWQGWAFLMLVITCCAGLILPGVFLGNHGHPWLEKILVALGVLLGLGGYLLASRHSRKF
jgi:hypothetical protein